MKVAVVAPTRNSVSNGFDPVDLEGLDYQTLMLAQGATMLRASGHQVSWHLWEGDKSGLADIVARLGTDKPELVAILAPTSRVESAWSLTNALKSNSYSSKSPKVALMGNHPTAFPQDCLRRCRADYVLAGGDFDFLLPNLCARLHQRGRGPAARLAPGIWRRRGGKMEMTGNWRSDYNLAELPLLDRELTGLAPGKSEGSGRRRAAHIFTSRDCWWARCQHCARRIGNPAGGYRVRTPERVLNEIGLLYARYSVSQVIDVSAVLPTGLWLRRFCQGMIQRGYNRKVRLVCGLRPGSVGRAEAALMVRAGFNTVIVNLHSVHDATLERIGTKVRAAESEESLRLWRAAGLNVTAVAEIGWPWESAQEAAQTEQWLERLGREAIIDSSYLVPAVPFPGTPLFSQAQARGWIKSSEWSEFDGFHLVMESALVGAQRRSFMAAPSSVELRADPWRRWASAAQLWIKRWLWRIKKYRYMRRSAPAAVGRSGKQYASDRVRGSRDQDKRADRS